MESSEEKKFLPRVRRLLRLDELPTGVRRVLVGMVGGTILLIGFALIFLPGPAILVIPLGLAILATEFAWARFYLLKARKLFEKAKNKAAKKRAETAAREKVNVP